MSEERNILLETGTNELELLEFIYGEENDGGQDIHLGLNVAKVREIIKLVPMRALPDTHDSIIGVFQLRGVSIQALDLKHFLAGKDSGEDGKLLIIMEFSKQRIAILVKEVLGIRRVKWKDIESFENVVSYDETLKSNITGLLHDGKTHIFMLDIEKIIAEVMGRDILSEEGLENEGETMSGSILTAEDSAFLRNRITKELEKAGYTVTAHIDGQKAWDDLSTRVENKSELPDLIVTDVEMPGMDGYTLTKNIKDNPALRNIPVVIFSSLITDDVLHKGFSVGADRQLSKPDLGILKNMIGDLLNEKKGVLG